MTKKCIRGSIYVKHAYIAVASDKFFCWFLYPADGNISEIDGHAKFYVRRSKLILLVLF